MNKILVLGVGGAGRETVKHKKKKKIFIFAFYCKYANNIKNIINNHEKQQT